MYHFRYYAIGHSYLKHGPFIGWQTDGFWGMAATSPECDYFHRLQSGIKNSFDCKIEAIAENQAAFERLCTTDATREKYTSSAEYAHMREVLLGFQPNVITIFVGGGNTIANDVPSLSLFFEVLYGLIASCKRPETVVVCIMMRENVELASRPIADEYGFITVDVSFLHESKGRDNPYYAYREYPEYDDAAAAGAVEFRTHPNDRGHAAIAESVLQSARNAFSEIPEGEFEGEYFYEKYALMAPPEKLTIKTAPSMKLSYFGFNVRQDGDHVVFGSAPGTGASLLAENFCIQSCTRLCAELAVEGAGAGDVLHVSLEGKDFKNEYALPIREGMHSYEIELSDIGGDICALRLSPDTTECVVRVRGIRFES